MEDEKIIVEFSKCMKYVFKFTHPKFEKIGLYPGQPQLLKALKKHGKANQKELADILMIKPSTLTVMIQRMEKQGFIKKEQDKNDLRKTVITLTDEGQKVLCKFEKIEEELEDHLDSILEKDEKIVLKRLLNKINISFAKSYNDKFLKGDE